MTSINDHLHVTNIEYFHRKYAENLCANKFLQSEGQSRNGQIQIIFFSRLFQPVVSTLIKETILYEMYNFIVSNSKISCITVIISKRSVCDLFFCFQYSLEFLNLIFFRNRPNNNTKSNVNVETD